MSPRPLNGPLTVDTTRLFLKAWLYWPLITIPDYEFWDGYSEKKKHFGLLKAIVISVPSLYLNLGFKNVLKCFLYPMRKRLDIEVKY